MANITKRELVERLSDKTGLTQNDTKLIVESFMNAVAEALQRGDNIELRGFGRFKVKEQSAHVARNPRTNEKVQVEKGYKPIFEASTKLRDRINEVVMKKIESM